MTDNHSLFVACFILVEYHQRLSHACLLKFKHSMRATGCAATVVIAVTLRADRIRYEHLTIMHVGTRPAISLPTVRVTRRACGLYHYRSRSIDQLAWFNYGMSVQMQVSGCPIFNMSELLICARSTARGGGARAWRRSERDEC